MNKISEFLIEGSVTLKKVNSPINGELVVKWDTFGGYQILGGGLWQVGGPVEGVWKAAFQKIKIDSNAPKVLILGLGGGTIAKIVRKKYNLASIVGVDIDEEIVNLGKDYLGLNELNVEINIMDAMEFLLKEPVKNVHDLICVDIYVGDTYPEKFESENFIKLLKERLSPDGILAVNRLYFGSRTKKAEGFLKLLKKHFKTVVEVYPKIADNVVYIANN